MVILVDFHWEILLCVLFEENDYTHSNNNYYNYNKINHINSILYIYFMAEN